MSTWAYRNYQLYLALVSIPTNRGATLRMTNQPGTDGGHLVLPDYVDSLDEHTHNQVLKKEAINYTKEEPLLFVTRTIKKLI